MKKFNKILMSLVLIAFTSVMFSTAIGVSPMLVALTLFGAGMAIGFAKHAFNLNTTMNTGLLYDGIVLSDTTYAGEAASQFIVKMMTENVMAQQGHMYVKDGIKKKFTIPRWDIEFEDFVQDTKATPTPGLEVQSVSGKVLELNDYMIYHEFNPRDYEDHWFATQLQGSTLLDTSLPVNIESVIIQEVLKRNGAFVNKLAWNGSRSLTTKMKYADGFKTKATASSATLKVGSPVTLDASNIAAQIQRGYDLLPTALKYDFIVGGTRPSSKVKLFVSPTTFDLYAQYQIAQANKGIDITKFGEDTFRGIKVVPIPNLPNNYYMFAKGMATPESNLWMGMNSMDDEQTLQLSRLQANSELYFIKGLAKIDFQIGWNEETVTYE